MDNKGLIHEELDIKILILFILRNLPGAVDGDTLQRLCQCDDGVGYFDYTDCLYNLVETGHIEEQSDVGFKITEKGIRNVDAVYKSIPASVREKALKELAPVKRRLERAQMIEARHYHTGKGLFMELAMSDSKGEVIRIRLAAGSEESAVMLEENFRENAEKYYNKIIDILSEKL